MNNAQVDIKEGLRRYIKGLKIACASDIKTLSREALEWDLITLEDFNDIQEDCNVGGIWLCHAFNVLLFRAYRGKED